MATDFAALLYIRAKSQMLAKLTGHTLLACLIWVRPFYCVRITNVGAFFVGCGMWDVECGCGMWDVGCLVRFARTEKRFHCPHRCRVCMFSFVLRPDRIWRPILPLCSIYEPSRKWSQIYLGTHCWPVSFRYALSTAPGLQMSVGFCGVGCGIDYSDVRCGMWDVGYGI